MKLSKVNNFDVIRLFAAIQVVIMHSVTHLHISHSDFGLFFIEVIKFFPGVPIFFTISGFLIMWSYERNKENLRVFYINRLLRIFPALWVCLFFTICVLLFSHTVTLSQLFTKEMLAWFITQISFLQFYTPDVLRSFGVGTPNGSLWTISLELQFYLAVPVLYLLIQRSGRVLIQLMVIVLIVGISILSYNYAMSLPEEGMMNKLMGVFLLPYLYNFVFGIILYKYWDRIAKVFLGKGVYWLIGYLLYSIIFSMILGWYSPAYWPNLLGFVANLILAFTIISLAYTNVTLSERTLKGYDFSYGIYIYHMLVVNVFIYLGYTSSISSFIGVLFFTFLMAVFSWICIERPALNAKKYIV